VQLVGPAGIILEHLGDLGRLDAKLHGEVIPVPTSHLNYTRREPLGVVLQITPWNAPPARWCGRSPTAR
jgi:acyl-CoA reductase-like NAD-dependent aldehyde dehydrogenase